MVTFYLIKYIILSSLFLYTYVEAVSYIVMICCRPRCRLRLFTALILLIFFITFFYSKSFYSNNSGWGVKLRLEKDQTSYVDDRGLKTIVGHYIGANGRVNITPEEMNTNYYSPVEGLGENGKPVQLASREIVRARDLFTLHGFNIVVSDKININRSLPDMRSSSCAKRDFELDRLPTASIIIVFHNEAWSTLMRTVMSVINRSPKEILKEIILVDDASERKYLRKELENAISKFNGVVKILRSKVRSGLVNARLLGARSALGDALVFLDAHCEVTKGWLEPLLDRAGSDDVFVCPHIDLLSDDTFAYLRSTDAHWGAFSRRLHFRWLTPSVETLNERSKDPSKPYPTPAMAGGLFAVRKSLFWRIGGYDEQMHVWGGENLELSWRAWQCGARVEIDPCSRVGHVFRRKSPYTFPGGVASVLHTNLARAALVWMDEWANFVFKFNPAMSKLKDLLLVRERVELREKLNCKSFRWYLDNVWPEHFFPAEDRWFGRIKNGKGACLCSSSLKTSPGLGGVATGATCLNDLDLDGLLVYTKDGQIMADEGLCLERSQSRVMWKGCSGGPKQKWIQKGPKLKFKDLCLTLASGSNTSNGVGSPLLVQKCIESNEQIWKFESVPWR